MSFADVQKMVEDNDVKFVDFRFTDSHGKEQHVSAPSHCIEESLFEDGRMFDGSSIEGWKDINESDMIMMPDSTTAVMDPFCEDATMNIRCTIVEPADMQGYSKDPRSLGQRAEEYLKSTGIGDTAYFGPEPEVFVFDDIKWHADMSGAGYSINSEEAAWSSNHSVRRRQQRPPARRQGRLRSRSSSRLPARHSCGHVYRYGADGPAY